MTGLAALADKLVALEQRFNALVNGLPWQPMTPLQNSWLSGSPAMQYRLRAGGKLEIQGFMSRTTGVSGSSQFFTLPPGYYNIGGPVIRKPMFAGFVSGWFYVSLDGSGNLVVNTSTAITEAQFDTSFTIV